MKDAVTVSTLIYFHRMKAKELAMLGKLQVVLIALMLVGIFLSVPGIAAADDVLIIGNRSVPESELSPKEIKKIYLGRKNLWSNGLKVVFVTSTNRDVSKRFLKSYVKKNPDMYRKYWKKKMFTGSGKPPLVFEKEKELVKYVAKTKGAVGYISAGVYSDSVKILSVLH